jgi:hypothetical protein
MRGVPDGSLTQRRRENGNDIGAEEIAITDPTQILPFFASALRETHRSRCLRPFTTHI